LIITSEKTTTSKARAEKVFMGFHDVATGLREAEALAGFFGGEKVEKSKLTTSSCGGTQCLAGL
jgi:hypothetical protein